MHAATAVSGSGPAYLYAFIEALGDSRRTRPACRWRSPRPLARATTAGAGRPAGRAATDPAELRRQVTSPGRHHGQAALRVLMGEGGFPDLLGDAVGSAVKRSNWGRRFAGVAEAALSRVVSTHLDERWLTHNPPVVIR